NPPTPSFPLMDMDNIEDSFDQCLADLSQTNCNSAEQALTRLTSLLDQLISTASNMDANLEKILYNLDTLISCCATQFKYYLTKYYGSADINSPSNGCQMLILNAALINSISEYSDFLDLSTGVNAQTLSDL